MNANETTAAAINIGDKERSFDFSTQDLEGPRACYVEGTVERLEEQGGCLRYVVKVDRQVFGGEEVDDGPEYVCPPVNGTRKFFGGTTNGVHLIEQDEDEVTWVTWADLVKAHS